MSFARKLKQVRVTLGISQSQLASLRNFRNLIDALDTSADVLLERGQAEEDGDLTKHERDLVSDFRAMLRSRR